MSETQTAEPTASTALVVVESRLLPTIVAHDKDDILGTLAAKVAAFKPDISTPTGRAAMRTLAHEIRRGKADLIRIGKSLTEEWRKQTKAVNAECNIIEERMDALAEKVRAQLTEWENREKARVAAHEEFLAAIKRMAEVPYDMPPDEIRHRLHLLDTGSFRKRDWQEFRERYLEALETAVNSLRMALAAAEKAEADARELERLRAEEAERQRQEQERLQREREERIAAEAAERAKQEAEAKAAREAEQVRQEAEAEFRRVEAERQAAEAKTARIEAARIEGHKGSLAVVIAAGSVPAAADSAHIALRLDIARRAPWHQRDWQEFADQYRREWTAAEAALTEALAKATESEAITRENERIAAERAERERHIAEQQRIETARQTAIEEDRKRAADEKRKADAEREKIAANKAHRARVRREAADAIGRALENGDETPPNVGQLVSVIIAEIDAGKIPHVTINY